MHEPKYVIKNNKKRSKEKFDKDKLYKSIVAACLSIGSPEGEANLIAKNVCSYVSKWVETKFEITSNDIRRKSVEALTPYNPEAAYIYKHFRQII